MDDSAVPTKTGEQEIQDARILSPHLDPSFTADFAGTAVHNAENGNSPESNEQPVESSLRLQGGDVHRNMYQIAAKSRRAKLHQRAATFSHRTEYGDNDESEADDDEFDVPPVPHQLAPGGFRRAFLQRQSRRVSYMAAPVTKNFISFLELYGNFAGEDLEESDEDETVQDEEEAGERRPLLGRRMSSKRPRAKGDAGNVKTFFTLLKAFIGTGIMFLPKAFKNGGMLFSSITLISVAVITSLCFHLLLQCRQRVGGGYGELGEAIGGQKLRSLILFSITISQIGFVCAGLIFVADNLKSFLTAITHGRGDVINTDALIGIQMIVLIPLAFIRNISKLGPAALLADVFILIGLTYIYWYDVATIIEMNGFNPTIELFNPRDFTLTIGAAIFTFEGIGLILPIQSSMREPEQFNKLLYLVMLIITVIFTSVGFLCYGTFGELVSVEIIDNYPQTSKLVNAVQFLYAMAVMVGTPVQLFPALRIMEGKLFGHRSGKQSTLTKWKKNAFRTALVLCCGLISVVGASSLDKFVALIGSFACVPLVYIYPAFLHFKGVASSKAAKIGDMAMVVIGIGAMLYTTAITITRWAET